jgi:NTE family protein
MSDSQQLGKPGAAKPDSPRPQLPGRVVLVLQGGGALGAYEGGVYQALHDAGIEPDWVIGTSIGAINGAIISGNKIEQRPERLREFWSRIQSRPQVPSGLFPSYVGNYATRLMTLTTAFPDSICRMGRPLGVRRRASGSKRLHSIQLNRLGVFFRI